MLINMKKILSILFLFCLSANAQPTLVKAKQLGDGLGTGSVVVTGGANGSLTYSTITSLPFASTAQVTSSLSAYQLKLNGTGFVVANGTVITYDNSTYLTTSSAAGIYVPYTGATSAVNLGSQTFSTSGQSTIGALYVTNTETVNGAWLANSTGTIITSLQTPTVFGSSASGGTLYLQSTSNATKGFVIIGSTTGTIISKTNHKINGVLNIYDSGTQTINGGLVSQVNGAVLSLGVNTGSFNLYGGAYDVTQNGAVFQVDSRAGNAHFTWNVRQPNVSAAASSTTAMSLTGAGVLTLLPQAGSHFSAKNSASGFVADIYDNSTHKAMEFYGDNSAHGSIIRMYSKTTTNNIQLVGDGSGGQPNFFLTARTGFGTSSPVASALVELSSTTQGFLPPRMTTTQKNAISSPATGLVVFDTTLGKLCVYTGAAWETITSS